VRGDVNKITIGENTSIGDRAIIHVAKIQGDLPTIIGDNVTIGAGSMIHAATIKDHSVVGASAQVLDGAIVDSHSIISPGAVVTPGTRIPSGEMWAGSPAKLVRKLTSEEIASIATYAEDTARSAIEHAVECSKDYKQVAADEEIMRDRLERDPEYFQPRDEDPGDIQGMGEPGRIFDSTLMRPEEGLKMNPKDKK
jgi:carbonic anhydrase/acetyltransferase-like protein (isoleucine patch superfamily)